MLSNLVISLFEIMYYILSMFVQYILIEQLTDYINLMSQFIWNMNLIHYIFKKTKKMMLPKTISNHKCKNWSVSRKGKISGNGDSVGYDS